MIEWDVAFRLETTLGTLYFNDAARAAPGVPWSAGTAYVGGEVVTHGGNRWYAKAASTGVIPGSDATKWERIAQTGYFALVEEGCKAKRDLRVVSDPIPQADGEIFHRRFRSGTEVTLQVQLWETSSQYACGEARREMGEQLFGHLDALINNPGRLFWQPTGYGDERFLESARYMTPAEVSFNAHVPTVTFTIDSPLPYVLDKTQVEHPVPVSTTTPIIMPEFSTNFWPVIKVDGAFSTFQIWNNSVQDEYGHDLTISYGPPGPAVASGHYAEIVTFNETIYLDGSSSNLKSGIDATVTDYFYLKPGTNNISIIGASCRFLVNPAWPVN